MCVWEYQPTNESWPFGQTEHFPWQSWYLTFKTVEKVHKDQVGVVCVSRMLLSCLLMKPEHSLCLQNLQLFPPRRVLIICVLFTNLLFCEDKDKGKSLCMGPFCSKLVGSICSLFLQSANLCCIKMDQPSSVSNGEKVEKV